MQPIGGGVLQAQASILRYSVDSERTTPSTLFSVAQMDDLSINKVSSICAKDQSGLKQLSGEIHLCQNIIANSCEEFTVAVQCLLDAGQKTCSFINMPSFEEHLRAFLIETYQAAPFASDCSLYRKLQGNIFHMSTDLCSQNYIDDEKVKKEECSIATAHNIKLQLQVKRHR